MNRALLRPLAAGPAALGLALAGCQSYQPQPLDLDAHRAAWAARVPEAEGVAAFAARLQPAGEGAPVFDPADGLTLQEAEAVALFFNPELRVARLRAEAALATLPYAGLWEDPEFSFDAERILADVSPAWVLATGLSLTIPVSGSLEAREDRASAVVRAERSRVAQLEWRLRAEVRSAWVRWSAAGTQVELTRELLERLDGLLAVAASLEEAGELTRTEARLLRIERAMRESELRSLEGQEEELRLALKGLMGLVPWAPVALVPLAAFEAPAEGDVEAALALRNVELAWLREQYEVAEQELRIEVREQYPDLTLGGGYGREDGDDRALVGIGLRLPVWNRNRFGVAEARAAREVVRAEFEGAYESLVARLAAATVRVRTAAANREHLERTIVPLVDEQYEDVRRLAGLGDLDALVLLESITRQHDTKVRLVEARLAESMAAVQVAELVGPRPAAGAPDGAGPQGVTP